MKQGSVWLGAVALIAAACGSGGPGGKNRKADPCEVSAAHQELEIGTGVTSFEPVNDGGTLHLVHGPQGGYHVEIGLRARHLDASEFLAGAIRGYVDGALLANVAPWFDFRCTDDGQESWGTLLIFRATPDELHLRHVDVEVDVTDVSGNEISADATFLIEDPELL